VVGRGIVDENGSERLIETNAKNQNRPKSRNDRVLRTEHARLLILGGQTAHGKQSGVTAHFARARRTSNQPRNLGYLTE
jgi:hypothetical protein